MFTLSRLAQLIGAELVGDPEAIVTRAQSFESAGAGDVTFATDAAYLARLDESAATAIIVKTAIPGTRSNLIVASKPKLAFARVLQILHSKPYRPDGVSSDLILGESTVLGEESSIHPRVTVGSNGKIGDRVTLHSGVVIGNRCSIGDDTVVHANVSIYDDCEIGRRVIVHSGTVIGSDGFGFVVDDDGRQVKVLQLGRVVIEDDCEIGANCAIDRGGFGDTVLRRGVKLDNLIQVGHNTEIGEDTVVAALTGFSGGTRIGRRCIIAGQVGTNQHIKIGDDATITARSGVTKSVPAKAVMGGTIPAQDYNVWRRCQVLYSRLPQLAERLRRLERLIEEQGAGSEK
ncbi:MAG TPA: UDP-3-O-(3-hydroxymyristoyl)glucosamine N-acyltransferase [Blastocatellia bacterium]|jgi:UDP-3-O-[3-hydroxymyristoyl] glucosamine N-acyltransferase|nr:UDP-3-O-(3-hydroxymyristoyl)glucosamine N-acyltransferase [Blastocatellia bacterium]